jgi:hypothetical protein
VASVPKYNAIRKTEIFEFFISDLGTCYALLDIHERTSPSHQNYRFFIVDKANDYGEIGLLVLTSFRGQK